MWWINGPNCKGNGFIISESVYLIAIRQMMERNYMVIHHMIINMTKFLIFSYFLFLKCLHEACFSHVKSAFSDSSKMEIIVCCHCSGPNIRTKPPFAVQGCEYGLKAEMWLCMLNSWDVPSAIFCRSLKMRRWWARSVARMMSLIKSSTRW